MQSGEVISGYLADVADHLRTLDPTAGDLGDPVAAYVAGASEGEFADVPAARLAHLIATHLRLGRRRAPREDLVAAFTPREPTDGWAAGGSTVVQVVTEDRSFLVDTATMVLARAGWSVRNLHHPIWSVLRDGDGVLTEVVGRAEETIAGTAESWMSLEAYPPLGASADALLPELLEALRAGLEACRAVALDGPAIRGRLEATRALLDQTAQPVSPLEVRRITELLRWLGEDHFDFFGYRAYTVAGDVFTPVPGSGLGILADAGPDPFDARAEGVDDLEVLVITKDSRRSPLLRASFLDYIGIRIFDRQGTITGEHRFLGLFNGGAYTESVWRIPLVADKAHRIADLIGHDPDSHSGHLVWQALSTYPRDDLFSASVDELASIVETVAGIQDRHQTRLFLRRDRYGRSWSALVYLPRDRYRTSVRERIQALLLDRLGGESLEFQASVTELVLARLSFVVRRPSGVPEQPVDVEALERAVAQAARVWEDDFNDMAADLPSEDRGVEFGEAYQSAYTARQAVADLRLANELAELSDLRFALYKPSDPADAADLRFKVITLDRLSLTRVVPHLHALGVGVIDERPFEWELRGRPAFVYDFGFTLPAGQSFADWGLEDRQRFAEAFRASYTGVCEADSLNRLVMSAGLTAHQVSWLRGISRYLQQAGIPFSQAYVATTLGANPEIAGALVSAFEIRFDPAREGDTATREQEFEDAVDGISGALDAVESLDHDRILRLFAHVLRAIVRTNAFATDRPALAFKLRPHDLAVLPRPRPEFEIFVYSPRVQGVHLRFGPVARGGLRWSDRPEDFRTEILGLAKAQRVKNTVIVPSGAKGGFVPQRLPDPRRDRAGWLAEGVACYRIFISSLLSLTDNLVDGVVVPPADVVRYDGNDTYLVVAADKGTATFSDIANAIAVERGFWLGDAFASGGSAGYDHKEMGITARGAWESVRRHFRELGVDCQNEDFTCVGIGDMSGDVFGNGMLRSRHIRLVAAFNHLHVFLDPTPDAEASFAERERLFALPRSSWGDYDRRLISPGGGVWGRDAKAVPISPQVRAALGLDEGVTVLTPAELIRAILTAPVDLLWNGGIGTYVKASTQTHADVGDRTNDGVRVDADRVRAKVAAEGGNLGWTQAARVEFAIVRGGRINTDFIDNSAGVDTSDHEVNIKILLAPEVSAGHLERPARDALLMSMTDEVAQLVLAHNIDQNLALSVIEAQAPQAAGAHESWMRQLEADGLLDRELEALPDSAEMERRIALGGGLSRPELSSLLAWTKIRLAQLVSASDLPDDPYLADRLVTYFPRALRTRYAAGLRAHPLGREIVTMVTVNRFVNSQGISAYLRLSEDTSSDIVAIVRAQLAARTILAVARDELALPQAGLDAATEIRIRVVLQQMIERATRWLLHNRRSGLDITREAAAFTGAVAYVRDELGTLLTPSQAARAERDAGVLREAGVADALARRAAEARFTHLVLPVVDLAARLDRSLEVVARTYFAVSAQLCLDRVFERVTQLPRQTRWDTMARAALRDDLQTLHAELTVGALESAPTATDLPTILRAWRARTPGINRVAAALAELTVDDTSLARMSVALRTVRMLLIA